MVMGKGRGSASPSTQERKSNNEKMGFFRRLRSGKQKGGSGRELKENEMNETVDTVNSNDLPSPARRGGALRRPSFGKKEQRKTSNSAKRRPSGGGGGFRNALPQLPQRRNNSKKGTNKKKPARRLSRKGSKRSSDDAESHISVQSHKSVQITVDDNEFRHEEVLTLRDVKSDEEEVDEHVEGTSGQGPNESVPFDEPETSPHLEPIEFDRSGTETIEAQPTSNGEVEVNVLIDELTTTSAAAARRRRLRGAQKPNMMKKTLALAADGSIDVAAPSSLADNHLVQQTFSWRDDELMETTEEKDRHNKVKAGRQRSAGIADAFGIDEYENASLIEDPEDIAPETRVGSMKMVPSAKDTPKSKLRKAFSRQHRQKQHEEKQEKDDHFDEDVDDSDLLDVVPSEVENVLLRKSQDVVDNRRKAAAAIELAADQEKKESAESLGNSIAFLQKMRRRRQLIQNGRIDSEAEGDFDYLQQQDSDLRESPEASVTNAGERRNQKKDPPEERKDPFGKLVQSFSWTKNEEKPQSHTERVENGERAVAIMVEEPPTFEKSSSFSQMARGFSFKQDPEPSRLDGAEDNKRSGTSAASDTSAFVAKLAQGFSWAKSEGPIDRLILSTNEKKGASDMDRSNSFSKMSQPLSWKKNEKTEEEAEEEKKDDFEQWASNEEKSRGALSPGRIGKNARQRIAAAIRSKSPSPPEMTARANDDSIEAGFVAEEEAHRKKDPLHSFSPVRAGKAASQMIASAMRPKPAPASQTTTTTINDEGVETEFVEGDEKKEQKSFSPVRAGRAAGKKIAEAIRSKSPGRTRGMATVQRHDNETADLINDKWQDRWKERETPTEPADQFGFPQTVEQAKRIAPPPPPPTPPPVKSISRAQNEENAAAANDGFFSKMKKSNVKNPLKSWTGRGGKAPIEQDMAEDPTIDHMPSISTDEDYGTVDRYHTGLEEDSIQVKNKYSFADDDQYGGSSVISGMTDDRSYRMYTTQRRHRQQVPDIAEGDSVFMFEDNKSHRSSRRAHDDGGSVRTESLSVRTGQMTISPPGSARIEKERSRRSQLSERHEAIEARETSSQAPSVTILPPRQTRIERERSVRSESQAQYPPRDVFVGSQSQTPSMRSPVERQNSRVSDVQSHVVPPPGSITIERERSHTSESLTQFGNRVDPIERDRSEMIGGNSAREGSVRGDSWYKVNESDKPQQQQHQYRVRKTLATRRSRSDASFDVETYSAHSSRRSRNLETIDSESGHSESLDTFGSESIELKKKKRRPKRVAKTKQRRRHGRKSRRSSRQREVHSDDESSYAYQSTVASDVSEKPLKRSYYGIDYRRQALSDESSDDVSGYSSDSVLSSGADTTTTENPSLSREIGDMAAEVTRNPGIIMSWMALDFQSK